MSYARLKFLLMAALAAVCGAFLPGTALAIDQITNTASVDYSNEALVAQTTATGSTTFAAESDPVLLVVKTRNPGSGPSGTPVTFSIKITYPVFDDDYDFCGDDSDAKGVVVTDPIPSGFTYVLGTLKLSEDNGAGYTTLTDPVDGDEGDFNGTTKIITVSLGTLTEGMGDAACDEDTARIITFQATKD
jgi:hypothetical protein